MGFEDADEFAEVADAVAAQPEGERAEAQEQRQRRRQGGRAPPEGPLFEPSARGISDDCGAGHT